MPAAIGANALGKGLICPHGSGPEAAWAGPDFDILAPRSLIAIANHFRGTQVLSRPEASVHAPARDLPNLADIKGQESAKRALEVAAAGGHNLLTLCYINFQGSQGSGMSWRDDRAYEEAQLKAFLEWREYWSWRWERWRYFLAGASTVWAGFLLWQLLA